ncbi:60S ribosomal protein L6 [Dionaea muscipula]
MCQIRNVNVKVEKFEDKYFSKKSDYKKNMNNANEFFDAEKPEKQKFPQEKKDDQKIVDAALIKLVESVPI